MSRKTRSAFILGVILAVSINNDSSASETVPAAAWRRSMGLPLEDAGRRKASLSGSILDDGYWQGAPVGGFGAGTFSRSYRGDFVRWHLKAGVHKYAPVAANQFALFQQQDGSVPKATVLHAGRPEHGSLGAWEWDYPVGAGEYRALYPKAWFVHEPFDGMPARVIIEQFSPLLPDNYRESSYPVAVSIAHLSNPSNKPVTVAVLLSWTNMVGWFRDFSIDFRGALNQGNVNSARSERLAGGTMKGIVFDRARRGSVEEEWDGQFVIAAVEVPGIEVSYMTTFDPAGEGAEVWRPFASDGRLSDSGLAWRSGGEPLAGAVAVRVRLQAGERRSVPFVVAWDLPVIQFGGGAKWVRRYTEFFGASGTNAWAIARTGLEQAERWSGLIDEWQTPYVEDASKPLWYRGMLWNELYALADLGTVWARPKDAPAGTPWTFSALECFDYPFYETLDVRFYGSMPLVKFWPEIEKDVMRSFAETVPEHYGDTLQWIWKTMTTGKTGFRQRKSRGAVPHDLGAPQEDPFIAVNQFSWQNTDRWKDLNSKFVLLLWRAYVFSGAEDLGFLRDTWPAARQALDYLGQFDTDGDGLPESEGFPDQTYDTWPVKGESAYVGGLFLAALRAAEQIAERLGDVAAAEEYRRAFTRAQRSYIAKLWTGEYLRYDTGSEYRESIMADQLAGQWYANLTGLGDIVPFEMRRSAIETIFKNNVMRLHDGAMGALNGMGKDGEILSGSEQAHEVWSGTTLGLAGLMLSEGLRDEAFTTARGVYRVVYERFGYWFRTPEAWDEHGQFRASMYMRPGSIWAMEMLPECSDATSAQAARTAIVSSVMAEEQRAGAVVKLPSSSCLDRGTID
ncbi:MAG: glucosylceramidase [Vicinamibacteria bacterium]|nr:glucosylceramidase [Vicinamibacteria bacterium]